MNEIDARTSTLLNELLWLATEAHQCLQAGESEQRWYQLGQRNTYARAAGILLESHMHEDAATIAERVVDALTTGTTDLSQLSQIAIGDDSVPTRGSRTLEWVGPLVFNSRYGGVPGIDQDYGMRWGRNGDQRISLRRTPGATEGMLYAYDRTWDEYALLQRRVAQPVVERVFTEALHRGEHLAVEDFDALIQAERARPLAPAPRETVTGVER